MKTKMVLMQERSFGSLKNNLLFSRKASNDITLLIWSKIDKTITKKTGWRFIDGEWVHKNDEDEARSIPRNVDPPMTIESNDAALVNRLESMDAFLRDFREEVTDLLRGLDKRVMSFEHDFRNRTSRLSSSNVALDA
ncbi:hypothetical protein V6N13_017059 [Hibiscus sabdariffa]